MGHTLAIMLTMTTYGTWLRGAQGGWINDGELMPPNPILEAGDRKRMKHDVYLFDDTRLLDVGEMIGRALIDRMDLQILALTAQTWHAHIVFAATRHDVADVVKCAKDAARYGLRPGRPIWTDGYDKRFCFDERTTHNRVNYVERHNARLGLAARPWDFITPVETYLADFAARR
jgi:hypothetical protein